MAFGNPFTRWIYNHSPAGLRNMMASVYSRGRGQKKFGPKFDEHLADLERLQWYDNQRLRDIQEEKLRRVIWQAGRFVPFYKRTFAELGVSATASFNRDSLARLPVLEKSVVQANSLELRSLLYPEPEAAETIHTSGTSGKPVDVLVARDYLKLEKAYLWLQRAWCGVKPGDRTAYFTGHPIVPIRQRHPPFWVYDRSENRMFFSLQHMTKQNFPSYAQELIRFQPLLFVGYPTAIYLMALHLCDVKNDAVRPRGVFTASETLFPHQRRTMEQAFSCKVMDLYGQSEYCGMIMQCDCGNYHVQEDYGVIEILAPNGRPAQPDEVGEIICTGLNNLAMPFIRYRTGDTAIPKNGTCTCGRGGALVERITGRTEDLIVTPDGRFLSRLDFVFKELSSVEEAQLVQETRERLRVRIVPRGQLTERDKSLVIANLRERAGDKMIIEIEIVDQIPRLPNGKFRYVISKVPVDFCGVRQTGEVLGVDRSEK
jgi:phenylacetate-CoA ligase